jgi:hypothetical protein
MFSKHKKFFLYSSLSIFSLILLAAITLFSYQQAYAGKIYRNVYFGEIDLSGKTKKQAEFLLQEKFQNILEKEITISSNGKSVVAKLQDTGLDFDKQKIVDESYKIGRENSFVESLLTSLTTIYKKVPVVGTPFIDEEGYNNFVNIAVAQLNIEPKDATLVINNGEVILTNSESGSKTETNDLIDRLINVATTNETNIDLISTPIEANLQNSNFENAKIQAENLLAKKYTFSYADKIYTPTRTEIGNWIEFTNASGQYAAQFNSSNIKAYLNKIAKNFEVKKVDRKINASTGEVILEGKEGIYLDKDKTYQDMVAQMNSSSVVVAMTVKKEAPVDVKVLPDEGLVPGRFEGKYIDIDLTHQKLCRLEGSTVVDCFIISSGKPSMPTPTGTFSILSKNPKAWSAQYGLWMPYWQQIYGPYGIHELPEWPNGYKEGQDHLGTPVSHGCVRLGVGDAGTVFGWTEIGTPVYIHK